MRTLVLTACAGLSAAALWAAPVAGVVRERVDNELRPLPKTIVILYSTKDREIVAATKSDAEGRFYLDAPSGVYQLEASRVGYISQQEKDSLRLDCRQSCGPVDVELMRGAVLTGRAVDELGEPLAGVMIRAVPERAESQSRPASFRGGPLPFPFSRRGPDGSSSTDDRGQFRLPGLEPGVYTVTAIAATRGPTDDIAKATLEGVELAAGRQRDVVLTVRKETYQRFSMSGRVALDDPPGGDDGPPPGEGPSPRGPGRRGAGGPGGPRGFGGPRLFLRMLDGAPELRRFSMRAEPLGRDGSFAVNDLPAGRYAVQVTGRGRGGRPFGGSQSLGVINLDHNLTGLVLSPLPPSGVAGAVRFDGEDRPSRIALRLEPVGDAGGRQMLLAAMPDYNFRNDSITPGEYRVESLAPEYYVVEARSGDKPLPEQHVHVNEGRVDDLQLVVSDQTAVVTGLLRRGEAPAADVEVRLDDGRGERTARTDENGRFAFDNVRPGNVVVSSGALRREFPAAAGAETDVDLTLKP